MALAAILRLELSPPVDVVVVYDGSAALEAASGSPAPHAVVLDIDMPLMTGIEAAAAIRRLPAGGPRTTLVAMSGDDNLLIGAERSGHFEAILRKPIDMQRLLGLLRAA